MSSLDYFKKIIAISKRGIGIKGQKLCKQGNDHIYALIEICYKGPHRNICNIVLNLKWLYSLVS